MRLLLILLALALPSTALAVPLQLAHHGQLLDGQGDPITGQETITFRLWDAVENGNEVWSEVVPVDVVSGHYSTLLNLGTLGRDALKTEPSLWLEMEIDSETLAPRQPVAATPYALVADTAENVDGGTVNASSISVNNSTVIDATGTWTGGTGSIGWSALNGVPADLDDGDADTLGGLSCADGDRAVWNDSNQLWECGSATVTLDRLDTATATSGQVLTYDGGQTAWEDPVLAANSPCSLTTLNEPLNYAEVDCGGTPVFMRTWRPFAQVDVGGNHTCGLASSGSVQCWGANSDGQSTQPGGMFTQVSAGNVHTCGIESSGSVQCWGDDSYGQATPPQGTFSQVSAGSNHTCGIESSGSVQCWGADSAGQSTPPAGTFTQVSAGFVYACGIDSAGSVQCWGYNAQGQSTPTFHGGAGVNG